MTFSTGTVSTSRFEYRPPVVQYGPGCVGNLADELASADLSRALVVCGKTVGSTTAVIDPVTEGLGDRVGDVFAETTPRKRLDTAFQVCERVRRVEADVLVGLGGGSSLDVAKIASLLECTERSREAIGAEFEETGTIQVPDESLTPVVAIPTTLAGADISQAAGITASPKSGLVESEVSGGVSHPAIMPHAVFADPKLIATTPRSVLTGSVMNGFDKGVETLYAHNATVFTDATAVRGLEELTEALLAFGRGNECENTYDALVRGLLCVQFGISRPGGTTLSLVHSFGHALARNYPVQQGDAHAVVVPHVLEFLFEHVDGRRTLLARGLGVDDADNTAAAVIERVTEIRDTLELPSRLRDVSGPDRESFPEVASTVLEDSFMENAPLEPSQEDIESVLKQAW